MSAYFSSIMQGIRAGGHRPLVVLKGGVILLALTAGGTTVPAEGSGGRGGAGVGRRWPSLPTAAGLRVVELSRHPYACDQKEKEGYQRCRSPPPPHCEVAFVRRRRRTRTRAKKNNIIDD
ncbi:hypothetical protein AXF42_Ash018547 [Apostasia shenzhenica]|uniref:Uncharacterized protein n=1 Tax=Apostasia shenzhenica TaxID=1088818 RepID=A0A2I0APU3_9ASPA|nr:hypothetical protein AXF42_Ash018547 [Apostasia shenzhenica]